MGDLKKKKPQDDIGSGCESVTKTDKRLEIFIERKDISSSDDQIIARLREYIQKFYEMQEKKLEQEERVSKKEED